MASGFKKYSFQPLPARVYAESRLGYSYKSGVSMYDLISEALSKDGLKRPEGMSSRLWAFKNVDHISKECEKIRPAKRAKNKKQKKAVKSSKKYASSILKADPKSDDFLVSFEWRKLRMMALKKHGATCQCCGASRLTGAVIHVDHIKPRKLYPELALDIENLQVLCDVCNHGKGNWDMTDWR